LSHDAGFCNRYREYAIHSSCFGLKLLISVLHRAAQRESIHIFQQGENRCNWLVHQSLAEHKLLFRLVLLGLIDYSQEKIFVKSGQSLRRLEMFGQVECLHVFFRDLVLKI